MAELVKKLLSLGIELLPRVLSAIAILMLTRFATGLVNSLLNRVLGQVQLTLRKFAIKVAETFTLIAGASIAMNALGIDTSSVIALVGAAGLAIGLAWQDNLSNVASGVMLITIRPFEVGDLVEGSDFVGSVDEIGIFSTSIITSDNIKIIVPNRRLLNENLKNKTTLGKRRIDITVHIGDRPLDPTMSELVELACSHSRVLKEPPPECLIASFWDKNAVLSLRCWCEARSYDRVRSDVQKIIIEALRRSDESDTSMFLNNEDKENNRDFG